ncbi:unnamed protein product [Closterium sp. NIES-54]
MNYETVGYNPPHSRPPPPPFPPTPHALSLVPVQQPLSQQFPPPPWTRTSHKRHGPPSLYIPLAAQPLHPPCRPTTTHVC